MRSRSAQAPFNIPPDCSFSPCALPASHRPRVNEGLMETAPVQQLADLRGTLNYLAAGNLLLPEASLSHCRDACAVALRERTMRSGSADASKFPVLFYCKMQDCFRTSKISKLSFYFKSATLFNLIATRDRV